MDWWRGTRSSKSDDGWEEASGQARRLKCQVSDYYSYGSGVRKLYPSPMDHEASICWDASLACLDTV